MEEKDPWTDGPGMDFENKKITDTKVVKKRPFNFAYYIMTYVILFIIMLFASAGELFSNFVSYPVDILMVICYVGAGYFLVNAIVYKDPKNKGLGLYALTFIYFYSAFACFVDGHVGGWSHSTTLGDKIGIILITMPLYFFTIYIPLIFAVISFAHNKGLVFFFSPSSIFYKNTEDESNS